MTDLRALARQAIVSTVVHDGIPGKIGRHDGVTTTYFDPSGNERPERCWVRVGSDGVEMVCVNIKTPHLYDTAVRVADRGGVPTVIGVDEKGAEEWAANGTNTSLPNHRHDIESFNPDFVESLRFLPLLVWPSNPLAMTVTANPGVYWYQGLPYWFSGATTSSLSSYVPTGGNLRHFVIIAIDRSTGGLTVIDGADVGNPILPVNLAVSDIAAIDVADKYYMLAAIQFYPGQTIIRQSDIRFDLRQFNGVRDAIQFAGSGSVGPGPNTVTLYYAGIDFKVVADYTIAVPSGRYFWPGEIGAICDTLDTLTTQPTVRAGITGSLAKLLTATVTTELTAEQKRETFTALTPEDGETAVTVGITSAAVATTFLGTFYIRGILK